LDAGQARHLAEEHGPGYPNGPVGLATKIREVHRGPGGKRIATLVKAVEYEPDRRFGCGASKDYRSRSDHVGAKQRRYGLAIQGVLTADSDDANRRADHERKS
jgi:hypothetical protein